MFLRVTGSKSSLPIIKVTNALRTLLKLTRLMRQTHLPSNWRTDDESDSASSSSFEEEEKLGKKAVPLYWTRVKSLE